MDVIGEELTKNGKRQRIVINHKDFEQSPLTKHHKEFNKTWQRICVVKNWKKIDKNKEMSSTKQSAIS